ncbi:MAG: branched-chain amino acid ABC transporter permease [Rubrivivax sp.]|jgi:branched-chain amino acid transport system permease protein|nr:branched-chain amino acid ABC transporter permease [Rubrivivax sp.]
MRSNTVRTLGLVALLLAALALPLAVKTPYFLQLIILALIWVVLSQGQNLIQGFTGYVSIAQAGFMGLGAYSSTLMSVKLGFPVWLTMLAAPAMTAVLALLAGYPSLRVKGHYFAIVTLAYNMVIHIVLVTWIALTGGEAGIPDVKRPANIAIGGLVWDFGTRAGYYYLVLLAAVLATGLCALVLHSRVGRVLLAIRQNEALIEAAGVQAWRYKLFAFVLSASLAGMAGALYAHFIGFINPDAFGVDQSLNAILAVILGGSGTLFGPVVGAFAVVFLPEYLRIADEYRLVVYGFILVVATIFMPRGLVPLVTQGFRAVVARLTRTSR